MDEWRKLFRDGAEPLTAEEHREFLARAFALLPEFARDDQTWSAWTSAVASATGRKGKALFMPLRKAVTGRERGPEMAVVMPLLRTPPKI